MTRLSDAEVHPLTPLRGADAARLLTSYLGGGRLPQSDEDRLLVTAHGNPFYLAELVTLLVERGALTTGESHAWRLSPQSLDGRLLSRDLAAVLAARIDALPADARGVLRDAAVVGDTVPAAALEALRERRGTGGSRPAAVAAVELERAVGELLHRRMLIRERGGYAFATPLMREAAYAGVGKADLAERHALLARWAAGLSVPVPSLGWSANTVDTFVADHAERAATLADAVSLRADAPPRRVAPIGAAALGRLARAAEAAGEPTHALAFLERAALLGRGPLSIEDRLVQASSLLLLGNATEALANAEKIAADAADDPAGRAHALRLTGRAHRALGDIELADRAWSEVLAVATSAGLTVERTEALGRLGMHEYLRGRLGVAARLFTEALHIAEAAGDRAGQAWALQNLAWVTTTRGDFTAAEQAIARAARIFAEQGDAPDRAWLRGTTAFARLLAGRLTEARRLAAAFLPFGERAAEWWAVGTLRAVGAFASAELGDLATADREARRAYRDFASLGDEWGMGFSLVVRGVVARGLGEPSHALDLLTDALRHGERTGHPLLIGMARTIRGFVSLDRGDLADAEADARTTLAVIDSHEVNEAAKVGPQVLFACARLAAGDVSTALRSLAELADQSVAASLIFPRRQAVAAYSAALLAAGRGDEAVAAARRAVELPAEDVRGRVAVLRTLARSLASVGELDEAKAVAARAVTEAYATQQSGERMATDVLYAAINATDRPPLSVPTVQP
jgi:tetratricopeptide (TPR) repeat protein